MMVVQLFLRVRKKGGLFKVPDEKGSSLGSVEDSFWDFVGKVWMCAFGGHNGGLFN